MFEVAADKELGLFRCDVESGISENTAAVRNLLVIVAAPSLCAS